jgi:hypothetical protein
MVPMPAVIGATVPIKFVSFYPKFSSSVKAWDVEILGNNDQVAGLAFYDAAFLVISVPVPTEGVSA